MSKMILTNEMAEIIRELRLQNKVASKEVALHLGRSASYISKIESGDLKKVEIQDFEKILEVILPECKTREERLDKLVDFQIKKYGFDIREKQVWFNNLDTVYRKMPIPKELIKEINDILFESSISVEELVKRINANEELSVDDLNDPEIPVNEWFEISDSQHRMAIKLSLPQSYIEDILDGKVEVCNYVTMQAIVHYLFKMQMFPHEREISDDDLFLVGRKWLELLDKHKFYTLSRKEMLLSKTRSKNQAKSILNEFDLEYQDTINNLLQFLKIASDMDVVTTNKSLKQLISNMNWDYNFMLRLMGFDFAAIDECSFNNKVQMLKEIKEIVNKYINMPTEQKRLETYFDIE